MSKRLVGYVRVSTVDQSESGCSLVFQREKIEAYCKLHELDLVHVYEDAGRSAKDIKGRPAFVESHIVWTDLCPDLQNRLT